MEDVAAPRLASRLLSRRTVLALVITLVVVGAALWRANIKWADTWRNIRHADLRLYLLAVVVYYMAMVVRTVRWRLLLRNAQEDCALVPLGETLLASFFVNCVVPAKMGDIYRAFRLRAREGIGASKAFGTIVAERLLDLFVLMSLLLLAGGLTFHNRVPRQLLPYLASGLVLCAIAVVVVLTMILGRGRRVLALLPQRLVVRYEHFRSGTVGSFGRWGEVVPLSLAVWGFEAGRLACVVFALGFGDLFSPPSFLLIALVAALLTTVPFTPGGIGLVEGGMIFVLQQVASVGGNAAASIALLDRSVSFGSVVLCGGLIFLLTHARQQQRSPLAVESGP